MSAFEFIFIFIFSILFTWKSEKSLGRKPEWFLSGKPDVTLSVQCSEWLLDDQWNKAEIMIKKRKHLLKIQHVSSS